MAQIYKNEAVIFDLDDLLYKEFDFMRSGFWTIAQTISEEEPKKLFRLMMAQYFMGNAVIDWVVTDFLKETTNYDINSLITIYRTHKPDISLGAEVVSVLSRIKENGNKMGLITDGRSATQRNKIEALKLNEWISDFTISEELGFEKPSKQSFLYFMERYDCKNFVYLADNYNKDFITPKQLGWRTIALLDNGLNIHNVDNKLDSFYYPDEIISNFSDIII